MKKMKFCEPCLQLGVENCSKHGNMVNGKQKKLPKCTMSVSGKHKFVDRSYKICETIIDQQPDWKNGLSAKGHTECHTIKRPIMCEYCSMIDDRKV